MKDKIINKLNQLKQYQSNINEHLPTLERYSKECNHVTVRKMKYEIEKNIYHYWK